MFIHCPVLSQFGKGVYFADMSSKSGNYCQTTQLRNTGLMLLSEVALGEMRELKSSDYDAHKLPPGKNSVKGLGKVHPNPKTHVAL
jgi:poly [ADP-ribose] polymerase